MQKHSFYKYHDIKKFDISFESKYLFLAEFYCDVLL